MALDLPNCFVGTASSSSTLTELHDQDDELVIYQGDGGEDRTGYWLVRPSADAGDRLRRVAFHNKDEGILKPSLAWTAAPVSGETYELYPPDIRPRLLDDSINKGLSRLSRLVTETLHVSNNDNTYTLDYDWLENERDVLEVYRQVTSSGTIVMRREWEWFKVFRDDDEFKLHLWPVPKSVNNQDILIEGRARYTELSSDSDTTSCPKDWVVAAALVELYKKLKEMSHGQDPTRWRVKLQEQRKELRILSRRYAPRRGRRIMTRTPSQMPDLGRNVSGEYLY